MSESDKIEKLELQVQQLQAKVFRNQNLNIQPQLDKIIAREKAEQISDGDAPEQNLDTQNPTVLRAERKNLQFSLDADTKRNYPQKFYQTVGRVKEIEKTLREMGESIE